MRGTGGSLAVFRFIDEVSEVVKNDRLTAFFTLKGNEEFLEDHFKAFPVMPGVLLLETLKQASAHLLQISKDYDTPYYRLLSASEIRFGRFVKPGAKLKVDTKLVSHDRGIYRFEGKIDFPDSDRGRVLQAVMDLEALKVDTQALDSLRARSRDFWQIPVLKV